jgi:linoleoyl-CoA desaturase
MSVSEQAAAASLRFAGDDGFHRLVKDRVAEDFRERGLDPRDSPRMFLKTAAILLWFGASYALLVFVAATWWQGALLCASLALAIGGIGFNIQHDANHGGYSRSGAVNGVLGFALDALGGSSYVWRWKHNIFHHTYTNVSGADHDIDVRPFARLAPAQPRRGFHRFQHLYVWALYGLLVPQWQLEDVKQLVQGRIGASPFPRPRGLRLVELLGGKALFYGWALVIPLLLHPWWVVLLAGAFTSFLVGLVLSVVFQLAHCVEEAEFPVPAAHRLERAWAVHQVETTVDFARRSRLATWYLGGLNFQIEHHLFPRICHVHYPRISRIVEATCAECGIRYAAHQGIGGAVTSHWRWLRRMGQKPAIAPLPS